MADFIRYTIEDKVATLVIDHAPVNAFNRQTLAELGEAVDALVANPDVKVVVVTGAGQLAFVAGADLGEIGGLMKSQDEGAAQAFIQFGQQVFNKIEASNKPFIAAINGVCLGGGLELAMSCHLRICGDRVKMGQPEINLGIIPGWGGTQRLARLVGKAKAVELILTGDSVTAQEAYRLNLVNKVVPGGEVLKTARDLARKIAGKGALATRAALEAITLGLDQPLDGGLALEAQKFGEVVVSNDAREGAAAFLQKRQPVFKNN